MIFSQAKSILSEVIRPLSYDQFFEEIVERKAMTLLNSHSSDRIQLFGDNPQDLILQGYSKFAPSLTCHARASNLPAPQARSVSNKQAFASLIHEYHSKGYTVRIPEVNDLFPELRKLTRALEVILEKPAGAVIFWSAAGAAAPVHHDEYDVLAIQLFGKKRWYISTDPPLLPNEWKGTGETPPNLVNFNTIDVTPGDLLYIPRGTAHTVDSTTESIHLAIGFVPVTLRDTITAMLEHLSDLDKPLRASVTKRADQVSQQQKADNISHEVKRVLNQLLTNCQSDSFIQDALNHRRSRMINSLPKLPISNTTSSIQLTSKIRRNPLAISNMTTTTDLIDFCQPGERILIHRGVEDSLRFIASTPEFKVADIPGQIDDEVRKALVNRLLSSGFLEVVCECP